MSLPPPPPPPPRPGDQPVTIISSAPRRSDLDALRGVAMLLGVVLHAAIPFVPYWEDGDSGGWLLATIFEFIHLWRMPLFFLLSGFFTAMLWRRRGLGSLLAHRGKRIAGPLVVFYVPIAILTGLGFVAGYALLDEGDAGATIVDPGEVLADGDPEPEGEEPEEDEEEAAAFSWIHLWFLWHLLWLVAAFALAARAVEAIGPRLARAPPAFAQVTQWILPFISLVPFLAMTEDTLGPDTADGILPAPHVLGFYATFFFFGALTYRASLDDAPIDRLGRRWPFQLAVGVALSGVLFAVQPADGWSEPVEVAIAWLVSIGAIGWFRSRFSDPSFAVRWLSDASYWMYLIHLPIVFALQGVVGALGLPAVPGFVVIVVATVALLIPSYRYLVRYTPIGHFLNGRKTREGDARLRASIAVSRDGS